MEDRSAGSVWMTCGDRVTVEKPVARGRHALAPRFLPCYGENMTLHSAPPSSTTEPESQAIEAIAAILVEHAEERLAESQRH
jgi:hypothetical protein